ncbi:MAG: HipA domain-containing protein [Oligoflexus sp.]|nr:HipA domain-containing protein [Oligoflexus sp.]
MNCPYCQRNLTSKKSLARGAGPICGSSGGSREMSLPAYSNAKAFLKKAQDNLLFEATQGLRPKFFYKEGDDCVLVKSIHGKEPENEFDMGLNPGGGIVEYSCNKIADLLGLPISRFGVMKIEDHECFTTELFTHKWLKADGKAQEFGALLPLQYFVDKEDDYRKLHDTVIKLSSCPEIDSEKFVTMTIYDALILNGDRHQENISMIEIGDTMVLSPVYDNMSAVYGCFDFNEIDPIKSKMTSGGVRMDTETVLRESFSLNPKASKAFCDKILVTRGLIIKQLDAIKDKKLRKLFAAGIESRLQTIELFVASFIKKAP